MSDTWRRTPKGKKREPRPPEKGGQRNYIVEVEDEEIFSKEEWSDEQPNDEDR